MTNAKQLPTHLHAAYEWIESAGEWSDAMSDENYPRDAAVNANGCGYEDVSESDLRDVIEWKRAR